MSRRDYYRDRRRQAASETRHAIGVETRAVRLQNARRMPTAEGQRDRIRELAASLNRPEPVSFPEWAYDARMEIRRLELLQECRDRRRRAAESP